MSTPVAHGDVSDWFWAEEGVRALLRALGYDPETPGLKDTPDRVVRAFRELTAGEHMHVPSILSRTFPADDDATHDTLIAVTGVEFVAVCEHHLMPFPGTATVAYLPAKGAPVVGLSKLARVVDVYARRLTMQERLTEQITTALDAHLQTLGSACIIRSRHSCLGLRGARKADALMVTSSLTGVFRDDERARNELLALCGG